MFKAFRVHNILSPSTISAIEGTIMSIIQEHIGNSTLVVFHANPEEFIAF